MSDELNEVWEDVLDGLGCILFPVGMILGLALLGLAFKVLTWAWAGL